MYQDKKIESDIRVSRNIRGIIHLTGRICRRFNGCVKDSFTVTLRNNSWIVSINNITKGYCLEENSIRANITIGLHYLMPVLDFKLFYERLTTEFSVLSDFSKPNIFGLVCRQG
jgi:hypothetical protein